MSSTAGNDPLASGSCSSESPTRPASTSTVEIHEDPEGLMAEYAGEDLGLLIGHHGQTIDAIQHLAYRFAMQGDGERSR